MCTLNKLPQVKPDLVRTDDDWEEWSIENLMYKVCYAETNHPMTITSENVTCFQGEGEQRW